MKKQKESKLKRDAFMSFLQTSATPNSEIIEAKKPSSDHEDVYEEYTEEFNNCNVCGEELEGAKKKKCEFCSMPACNDHLRKRRKRKGKWERICDNCEDKYLYDVYMKLETKADEALAVEEQITILKHDNFCKQAEERRQKRRQIGFKTMGLQQNYQEQIERIADQENKLQLVESQVESFENSVKQLQVFVERVTAAFKQNHEQNWNILSEQNARMAKELTKLEKRAFEIKSAIEKKEKEIENAFEAWEQKQFKKKLESEERAAAKKKKEACQIY